MQQCSWLCTDTGAGVPRSAVRFPDVAGSVIQLLMDFLGDTNTASALDVVFFVREIMETNSRLRPTILTRLLDSFTQIRSSRVCTCSLWIIGEYSHTQPNILSATEVTPAPTLRCKACIRCCQHLYGLKATFEGHLKCAKLHGFYAILKMRQDLVKGSGTRVVQNRALNAKLDQMISLVLSPDISALQTILSAIGPLPLFRDDKGNSSEDDETASSAAPPAQVPLIFCTRYRTFYPSSLV